MGDAHEHQHDDDPSCFRCASSLTQPLVCESCGILQKPPGKVDPFRIFCLERAADVSSSDLRKRLSALSRKMHPDFFVAAGEEARELAERNTAELNTAFEVLSDETQRVEWLIDAGGGPTLEQERQMPQEFLMEVLEWNETLEGAREGDDAALSKLPTLENELCERLEAQRGSLRALLTPLPPRGHETYVRARRELNAVRYLERALSELAEHRLDRAKGTAGPTE